MTGYCQGLEEERHSEGEIDKILPCFGEDQDCGFLFVYFFIRIKVKGVMSLI